MRQLKGNRPITILPPNKLHRLTEERLPNSDVSVCRFVRHLAEAFVNEKGTKNSKMSETYANNVKKKEKKKKTIKNLINV